MLDQKQKFIVIILIIVAVCVMVFYYINSTRDILDYTELSETNEQKIENIVIQEQEPVNIIVHITGAVKNNGIVEVKQNARINDVIEEAGGLNDDADLTNVNLAYIVADGQKIYIPSITDTKDSDTQEKALEEVITESAGINVVEVNENTTSSSSLVNINKADLNELQTLPGIGESTAQKILDYRNLHR